MLFPLKNFRVPAALACFLITTVAGFALDQWSKVEAFKHLCSGVVVVEGHYEPTGAVERTLIPGLVDLTAVTNQGAVFGVGQGKRVLFIAVSIGAIIFILYLFAQSGRQPVYQILLGMLLAGVLGNLYDRIRFSYVRDMIHGLPHWPKLFPYIFNVADSFLCTGVALMILYSLLVDPAKAKSGGDEVRASIKLSSPKSSQQA